MKFSMAMKQFKLNVLRLVLNKILGINCCFTVCIKKTKQNKTKQKRLQALRHLGLIWLRLDVMMDVCIVIYTTELYHMIQVCVASMIEGHGAARKKMCASYLLNLSVDPDGILSAVETCWSYEHD